GVPGHDVAAADPARGRADAVAGGGLSMAPIIVGNEDVLGFLERGLDERSLGLVLGGGLALASGAAALLGGFGAGVFLRSQSFLFLTCDLLAQCLAALLELLLSGGEVEAHAVEGATEALGRGLLGDVGPAGVGLDRVRGTGRDRVVLLSSRSGGRAGRLSTEGVRRAKCVLGVRRSGGRGRRVGGLR